MSLKKQTGLTAKQEAFARAYTSGDEAGNASAAYRAAYNVSEGTKPSTIHVEACKLLDHPKVAQRVQDLNDAKMAQHRTQGVSLRQRVQEGLLREATTAESPAARVRAWELVGKLDGVDAFGAERVETNATVTQKQAETELKQALTAALGDERVVDLFAK